MTVCMLEGNIEDRQVPCMAGMAFRAFWPLFARTIIHNDAIGMSIDVMKVVK